jgi:hypothetical protein
MTDEPDDITNPRTFKIYAMFCLVFGAMIGGGFYITFSSLHISSDHALSVIVILFLAACIPAVFLRWYKGDMKLELPPAPEDESDEE